MDIFQSFGSDQYMLFLLSKKIKSVHTFLLLENVQDSDILIIAILFY